MLDTRITQMLKIKHPIIGGTMMWISDADFVAAISEAGGLGVLASAIYQTKEDFAAAIDRIHELTDKPYAVNLNLFPSMRPIDNNEYFGVMKEKGVKIVETSGHSAPADLCGQFKDAGMIWIHKCVGIRYALKVKGMGVDIVTVVGYENGGATGKLDIGTMVLTPAVKDAVGDLPLIAGGGISDGRGLAALMTLGAEAVIIGTRLLTTRECPIHENLKTAISNAGELDTMLVMRSLNATHRVWINDAAQKCEKLESEGAGLDAIFKIISGENAKRMFEDGEVGAGIIACGQGVGLCRDVPTVAELFDRMAKEARDVVKGLSKQA
ncbi:Nitronate monooxygenase [Candidatus Desulfarcum epimagneticum]|uniref:Nitronate monooxygenase n=1 Tax=uncultured Desulfobacteraceae bacterium TaxID=218296 RepID=A0A484HF17_9BACT|nr:Nitronate monooxygenase [uncultured Desulfobacteraceae bacterium]